MNTVIETAIVEQLQVLDEQRLAEVLDFVQFLAAKSRAASSTKNGSGFDPMRFSGTVQWPVDGLAFQEAARKEWE